MIDRELFGGGKLAGAEELSIKGVSLSEESTTIELWKWHKMMINNG